jgi:hypothetical protein
LRHTLLCDTKYLHGIELGGGASAGHPDIDGALGAVPAGFGADYDV